MGLLGQNQNAFLADRIFQCFDEDRDGFLKLDEFTRIMDIMCNGSASERNQFSFRLMDMRERGYIDFQEFCAYFTNVILHWSSIINTHVKVDKDVLQRIFNKIDRKREGIIYCRQYSAALDEDPGILDWFSLLNQDRHK